MQALHPPGGMHTRPAGVGRTGRSTGGALRQRVQQCLRLFQVSRVEAFGEPMVDWCQKGMGFLALALLLPQASQAGRGTEFPRFRLLRAGYTDGLLGAVLRFILMV